MTQGMETCGEEARGGWSWKSHCEDKLSKDLNDVWEPVMQISEAEREYMHLMSKKH